MTYVYLIRRERAGREGGRQGEGEGEGEEGGTQRAVCVRESYGFLFRISSLTLCVYQINYTKKTIPDKLFFLSLKCRCDVRASNAAALNA